MKRSWIGLGLLLGLLVLGLLVTWAMGRIHDPIAGALEEASAYTTQGNWYQANTAFARAKDSWDKFAHFRACFADHGPIEEIDALFAQLQVYCQAQEDVAFAGGCMELAKKVAAVGDAHGLVWWNIL